MEKMIWYRGNLYLSNHLTVIAVRAPERAGWAVYGIENWNRFAKRSPRTQLTALLAIETLR